MQAELKTLIAQKDVMEKEIAQLSSQIELLDETKAFNTGLVDSEGFPRADINFGQLANYRNIKRRRAELNNDHSALMKQIQKKLFALHATFPKNGENHISQTLQSKQTALHFKKTQKKVQTVAQKPVSKIDYLTPYAKLSLVQKGAPADKAGLRVGDLVSEFADTNVYALDWMKQIKEAVKEGVAVKVVILRLVEQGQQKKQNKVFTLKDGKEYQKIQLSLIPSAWEGRGLLGCKIDPL